MATRTVVCGGGVIGAAVAYYLSLRGETPIIVESDGVASGASGAAAAILQHPRERRNGPARAAAQPL